MDQGANLVMKMIEEDGASLAKKAELCKQNRPDLVAEIDEFYSLYRSLAECYDHLNQELCKSTPPELQMQGTRSAPDTTMLTPDQKLGSIKNGHRVASVSSAGASYDLSAKDGSDSSTSSDSESESFNSSGNAYYSLPMHTEHKGLRSKIIELETDLPNMEERLKMDVEENGNYKELLSKVLSYEEELRVSKLNLQLLEEEIASLKNELAKKEYFMELAETLKAQLKTAGRDIEMKEAELQVERKRIMELQEQIADGTHELQIQLKGAQEEIIMLKAKLVSESQQVLDLQESIAKCNNHLSDRDDEVNALKIKLLQAEEHFMGEKACLLSNISSLSERENLLEASLREWELQGNSMQDKLRLYEAEKMELQHLHETQRMAMQAEISQLKAELGDRSGHVEILNKNLESLKLKYDMLMAEKDGMNAKVNTLIAELSSRENQMGQIEEHLRRMHMENVELNAQCESAQKLVQELRLRVEDQEKEVNRQRVELSAGAEEKREVIRQLCFSLDHYRSGYKELCQAFLQHKRYPIIAS